VHSKFFAIIWAAREECEENRREKVFFFATFAVFARNRTFVAWPERNPFFIRRPCPNLAERGCVEDQPPHF